MGRDSKTDVLHIVPRGFGMVDGVFGGGERYVCELARFMCHKVRTRIVTFGDEDREDRVGKLNIRIIGRPWLVRNQYHNPFSLKVLGEIRDARVIHCHQQHILISSFVALMGRLLGKQVFVTDLGGGGWDVSAYVSTDRWYTGHLHISKYSRSVYGQEGWNRAHVIYGGVDRHKFFPDGQYQVDGPVLYVGRLLPHKGIDYLIQGLPPGIQLQIVGKPLDVEFMSHLYSLAKGKRVEFLHEVGDGQLVQLYQRACCIVLPSVYDTQVGVTRVPELLGQTLLEGMACSIPAICTDVASMPEVVLHDETGFVVAPNSPRELGDRLQWLKDHPQIAQDMGRKGLNRVQKFFNWDTVVEKCLQLYGLGRE